MTKWIDFSITKSTKKNGNKINEINEIKYRHMNKEIQNMETIKLPNDEVRDIIVKDSIIKNYPKYIEYLTNRGYIRESLTIYENISSIVTINNLKSNNKGIVIDILCPPGRILSIPGIKSYPEEHNIENIRPFELKLASTDGDKEIDLETKIKILKKRILRKPIEIYGILYKDIGMLNYSESPNRFKTHSELYRFEYGIEVKGEDRLMVCVINPDIDIDVIKFNLGTDLWTRTDSWTRKY
jgi:hypothetical protein